VTLKEYKAAKEAMVEDLRRAGEVHRKRIISARRKQARDFALRMQIISDEYAMDNVHLALAPYFNRHNETRRRWSEAEAAKRLKMQHARRNARAIAAKKELSAKRKAHRKRVMSMRAKQRKKEAGRAQRNRERIRKIRLYWAKRKQQEREKEILARQIAEAERLKRDMERIPDWVRNLKGQEIIFSKVGCHGDIMRGTVRYSYFTNGQILLLVDVPHSAKPVRVSVKRVII
jgi:hypothetical protein